ncbi:ankyrin repeat protein [Ancylostoma ceylanicum]|uniref:Ankyrin repeat protein n=1 Tax=Ancylostoma ceylanicum TaxID=53326 RepID=A0A0D6L6G0_9BILA|nr:ankyrin repeat protein [Ancylostoma ceylanicum]
MGDAKAAGIPLLDFERSNEVAHKSSTQVTPKSKCDSYCSSTTSIAVEDANLDIENLRSITQQHARDGNVEALEALLDKHALLVNKPDMEGLTALHYAAKYGNVEVAELLLNRGALLESYTYKDCYAPFHMVAKYGRVGTQQHSNRESVVSFIDASAHRTQSLPGTERTPNASDPTTALVVLFVKRGGDVNIKDRYQMTPLDHATLKDNERIVRALLKNGANPNPDCIDEKDGYGLSAFLYAVSMDALETVKMLVESNTDILATDFDGRTAVYIGAKYNAINVLMYLLEIYRAQKAEEGASYPDMLLHEYGARLDILDEDERISLHRAASEGQTAVVRQLVEWDKRLMVHKDEHGNTPLHLAAENGRGDSNGANLHTTLQHRHVREWTVMRGHADSESAKRKIPEAMEISTGSLAAMKRMRIMRSVSDDRCGFSDNT